MHGARAQPPKIRKITGISLATSFAWRHKFLGRKDKSQQTAPDKAYIESINVPFSAKGARKPIKNKGIQTSILIKKPLGTFEIKHLSSQSKCFKTKQFISQIGIAKQIEFHKSAILTRCLKLEAKAVKSKDISTHSGNIIFWLSRFKGVATKYLQHYWNWYCILNQIKMKPNFQNLILGAYN